MRSPVDNRTVAVLSAFLPLIAYVLYYRLYHQQPAIMPEKKPFERLPKKVVPVNYELRLQPDLKNFTFDGNEDITVKVCPSLNLPLKFHAVCVLLLWIESVVFPSVIFKPLYCFRLKVKPTRS